MDRLYPQQLAPQSWDDAIDSRCKFAVNFRTGRRRRNTNHQGSRHCQGPCLASTRSAGPVSCFSTMFLITATTYNRAAFNQPLPVGLDSDCSLVRPTDAFGPFRLTPTIR